MADTELHELIKMAKSVIDYKFIGGKGKVCSDDDIIMYVECWGKSERVHFTTFKHWYWHAIGHKMRFKKAWAIDSYSSKMDGKVIDYEDNLAIIINSCLTEDEIMGHQILVGDKKKWIPSRDIINP